MEVTHGFQVINIRRSLSVSRGDTRGKVAHVACRDNDIRKQRDSAPVRFMLVHWARWSRRIYKHVYAQWHYSSSVSRITKDEPIPRFIGLFAYMLQGCEHIKWQPMNPGQPIFRSKPIRLVAFAYIFLLFSFSFFLFFYQREEKKSCPLVYRGSLMSFTSIRFTVTLTIVKICRLKMILPFIACRFPNDDSQSSCDMS